jgi:hypothetical protein
MNIMAYRHTHVSHWCCVKARYNNMLVPASPQLQWQWRRQGRSCSGNVYKRIGGSVEGASVSFNGALPPTIARSHRRLQEERASTSATTCPHNGGSTCTAVTASQAPACLCATRHLHQHWHVLHDSAPPPPSRAAAPKASMRMPRGVCTYPHWLPLVTMYMYAAVSNEEQAITSPRCQQTALSRAPQAILYNSTQSTFTLLCICNRTAA